MAGVNVKQLNTCPNFSADPFPKLQTGACAVIAQLGYKIFIEPAKCCVATCRVSTAGHLLLKDPDRGRLLTTATKRWLKPGTTWTRQPRCVPFSQAAAKKPVIFLPAPRCCLFPASGQTLVIPEFPVAAGQQVSLSYDPGRVPQEVFAATYSNSDKRLGNSFLI